MFLSNFTFILYVFLTISVPPVITKNLPYKTRQIVMVAKTTSVAADLKLFYRILGGLCHGNRFHPPKKVPEINTNNG